MIEIQPQVEHNYSEWFYYELFSPIATHHFHHARAPLLPCHDPELPYFISSNQATRKNFDVEERSASEGHTAEKSKFGETDVEIRGEPPSLLFVC